MCLQSRWYICATHLYVPANIENIQGRSESLRMAVEQTVVARSVQQSLGDLAPRGIGPWGPLLLESPTLLFLAQDVLSMSSPWPKVTIPFLSFVFPMSLIWILPFPFLSCHLLCYFLCFYLHSGQKRSSVYCTQFWGCFCSTFREVNSYALELPISCGPPENVL